MMSDTTRFSAGLSANRAHLSQLTPEKVRLSDHLKKEICKKARLTVTAETLNVWKVSDSFDKWMTLTIKVEGLRCCRQEYQDTVEGMEFQNDESLLAVKKLSKVFEGDEPKEGHVHIVVKIPSTGASVRLAVSFWSSCRSFLLMSSPSDLITNHSPHTLYYQCSLMLASVMSLMLLRCDAVSSHSHGPVADFPTSYCRLLLPLPCFSTVL
jgi:hypothetical protein